MRPPRIIFVSDHPTRSPIRFTQQNLIRQGLQVFLRFLPIFPLMRANTTEYFEKVAPTEEETARADLLLFYLTFPHCQGFQLSHYVHLYETMLNKLMSHAAYYQVAIIISQPLHLDDATFPDAVHTMLHARMIPHKDFTDPNIYGFWGHPYRLTLMTFAATVASFVREALCLQTGILRPRTEPVQVTRERRRRRRGHLRPSLLSRPRAPRFERAAISDHDHAATPFARNVLPGAHTPPCPDVFEQPIYEQTCPVIPPIVGRTPDDLDAMYDRALDSVQQLFL